MTINCPFCNKELEIEGISFKKKVESVLNIDDKSKTNSNPLTIVTDLGDKVIAAGNARARGTNKNINKIIFHSQGVPDNFGDKKALSSIQNWFSSYRESGKSSAHYFINFDGSLHRLVPEDAVAYHAGSKGNIQSIGVEVAGSTNRTHFTDAQVITCKALTLDIASRHPIEIVDTHASYGKPGCPFIDGSNNPLIIELNRILKERK